MTTCMRPGCNQIGVYDVDVTSLVVVTCAACLSYAEFDPGYRSHALREDWSKR